MTFEQLLLAAVEQRLLRPLDVQFALMVAQNDPPAVKLAAALLSRDAGEGHVCLPLSRLSGDEALSGKAGEIRDRLLAEAGAPEDWPGHCDAHRTAQRPGGDFRRARSPLRRRVRAMENAAVVARAGGKISN
ncbi:hypothetical protein [Klebsiella pneumoniae]|uniref:hypothetical protein n=1 Tax=Klebsiella pneumoniae TaxID=573 RepID=UPI003EE15091